MSNSNGFPFAIAIATADPTTDPNYPAGFQFDKLVELYYRAKTLKFSMAGALALPAGTVSLGENSPTMDLDATLVMGTSYTTGDDGISQTMRLGDYFAGVDASPRMQVEQQHFILSPTFAGWASPCWHSNFSKIITNITGDTFTFFTDREVFNPPTPTDPNWVDDGDASGDPAGGPGARYGHYEVAGLPVTNQATLTVDFHLFYSITPPGEQPYGKNRVKFWNGLYYPTMSFSLTLSFLQQDTFNDTVYALIASHPYEGQRVFGSSTASASITSTDPGGGTPLTGTAFGKTVPAFSSGVDGTYFTGFTNFNIDINDWWTWGGRWNGSTGVYVP